MKSNDIQDILSRNLNNLQRFDPVSVLYLCWFADDFETFRSTIVDTIITRIISPLSAIGNPYYQDSLVIFELIAMISSNCNPSYQVSFQMKIPQAVQAYLDKCEVTGAEFLRKLVVNWKDLKLFEQDCFDKIDSIFRKFDQSQFYSKHTVVQSQFTAPVEQRHTNREPEEHRFSRGWMRSAVEWENPIQAPLVVNYEISEKEKTEKIYSSVVIITPENEGVKCQVCGNIFERGTDSDGRYVFLGAIRIARKIIVHQQCHESRNKNLVGGFLASARK